MIKPTDLIASTKQELVDLNPKEREEMFKMKKELGIDVNDPESLPPTSEPNKRLDPLERPEIEQAPMATPEEAAAVQKMIERGEINVIDETVSAPAPAPAPAEIELSTAEADISFDIILDLMSQNLTVTTEQQAFIESNVAALVRSGMNPAQIREELTKKTKAIKEVITEFDKHDPNKILSKDPKEETFIESGLQMPDFGSMKDGKEIGDSVLGVMNQFSEKAKSNMPESPALSGVLKHLDSSKGFIEKYFQNVGPLDDEKRQLVIGDAQNITQNYVDFFKDLASFPEVGQAGKDIGDQMLGGTLDALTSVGSFPNHMVNYLNDLAGIELPLPPKPPDLASEFNISKPETAAEEIARFVGEVMGPYLIGARVGMAVSSAKHADVLGGLAAEFLYFLASKETDTGLSNILTKDYPALMEWVPGFLEFVPENLTIEEDEDPFMRRIKLAAEGMGLGLAVTKIFKGLLYLKKYADKNFPIIQIGKKKLSKSDRLNESIRSISKGHFLKLRDGTPVKAIKTNRPFTYDDEQGILWYKDEMSILYAHDEHSDLYDLYLSGKLTSKSDEIVEETFGWTKKSDDVIEPPPAQSAPPPVPSPAKEAKTEAVAEKMVAVKRAKVEQKRAEKGEIDAAASVPKKKKTLDARRRELLTPIQDKLGDQAGKSPDKDQIIKEIISLDPDITELKAGVGVPGWRSAKKDIDGTLDKLEAVVDDFEFVDASFDSLEDSIKKLSEQATDKQKIILNQQLDRLNNIKKKSTELNTVGEVLENDLYDLKVRAQENPAAFYKNFVRMNPSSEVKDLKSFYEALDFDINLINGLDSGQDLIDLLSSKSSELKAHLDPLLRLTFGDDAVGKLASEIIKDSDDELLNILTAQVGKSVNVEGVVILRSLYLKVEKASMVNDLLYSMNKTDALLKGESHALAAVKNNLDTMVKMAGNETGRGLRAHGIDLETGRKAFTKRQMKRTELLGDDVSHEEFVDIVGLGIRNDLKKLMRQNKDKRKIEDLTRVDIEKLFDQHIEELGGTLPEKWGALRATAHLVSNTGTALFTYMVNNMLSGIKTLTLNAATGANALILEGPIQDVFELLYLKGIGEEVEGAKFLMARYKSVGSQTMSVLRNLREGKLGLNNYITSPHQVSKWKNIKVPGQTYATDAEGTNALASLLISLSNGLATKNNAWAATKGRNLPTRALGAGLHGLQQTAALPQRIMTATDILATGLLESVDIHKQAIISASKRIKTSRYAGLSKAEKNDAFNDLVTRYINKPPKVAKHNARVKGSEAILMSDASDLPGGKIFEMLPKTISKFPIIGPPLALFSRVSYASSWYAFARTPGINWLDPRFIKQWKDPKAQAELVGRAMVGAGIMAYITDQYYEGNITGAHPEWSRENKAFPRSDKMAPEFSMWLGKDANGKDDWFDLSRFDQYFPIVKSMTKILDGVSRARGTPHEETMSQLYMAGIIEITSSYMPEKLVEMIDGLSSLTKLEQDTTAQNKIGEIVAGMAGSVVPFSNLIRGLNKGEEPPKDMSAFAASSMPRLDKVLASFWEANPQVVQDLGLSWDIDGIAKDAGIFLERFPILDNFADPLIPINGVKVEDMSGFITHTYRTQDEFWKEIADLYGTIVWDQTLFDQKNVPELQKDHAYRPRVWPKELQVTEGEPFALDPLQYYVMGKLSGGKFDVDEWNAILKKKHHITMGSNVKRLLDRKKKAMEHVLNKKFGKPKDGKTDLEGTLRHIFQDDEQLRKHGILTKKEMAAGLKSKTLSNQDILVSNNRKRKLALRVLETYRQGINHFMVQIFPDLSDKLDKRVEGILQNEPTNDRTRARAQKGFDRFRERRDKLLGKDNFDSMILQIGE